MIETMRSDFDHRINFITIAIGAEAQNRDIWVLNNILRASGARLQLILVHSCFDVD